MQAMNLFIEMGMDKLKVKQIQQMHYALDVLYVNCERRSFLSFGTR